MRARHAIGIFLSFVAFVCFVAFTSHFLDADHLRGIQWSGNVLPFGIATDPFRLFIVFTGSLGAAVFLLWGVKAPPAIFVLYMPGRRGAEGLEHGGPVYIETGGRSAYAAFSTRALGRQYLLRKGMPGDPTLVPLKDLGTKTPLLSPGAGACVLFDSADALDEYFERPQAFSYAKHLVVLGPVSG